MLDFLLFPHLEHSLPLTTGTRVIVGDSVGTQASQAFKVYGKHTGMAGIRIDAKDINKTNVIVSVFI